ncbi:capsid scaffold protein [Mandrillus leucophaeus cytomegalovirus]|nr:capsid scaffold protein [Mandrillus leucophaeus cytomegalovirus]AKI29767.1 capsid scaffold protein [Mandrillus leucophaeus cytomegalovirus]
MSHPLSAVATPAASSVAPSQAPLALAHDGVYLPKDAFFSLIGASRPMAEASGARAAYPAAHPPPAYPPVMSYEDPSRHYDYSAWLRRPGYDAGPPLPPPAIPMPYRRRDPMMDEVERAAWERGYAPSIYDHYGASNNGSWSRARSGALKRRRERDAASSDDEEDMSFPGEADHGKARKRLKAHHARDNAAGDSKGDRYNEIREALQELKREMLAVRQVAPSALLTPTQLAAPVVSSPTTTSPHQPEVATSDPPSKTSPATAASAVTAHSSKSSVDRGVVNASCRVAVPVDGIPPKDMVDLNRRLFVAALNKME